MCSDFDQNFFGKTIYQMQSEFVVVFSNFPVWDKMTFLGHLKSLATFTTFFVLDDHTLEFKMFLDKHVYR